MKNYLLSPLFMLFAVNANAAVDQCAADVNARIDYAYNEGGLKVKKTVGPIHFNEGTEQGGLALKVAYAVEYQNDPQVNPGRPDIGKVLIIAECTHDEPSRAKDKNKDGIFTLEDAVTLGR